MPVLRRPVPNPINEAYYCHGVCLLIVQTDDVSLRSSPRSNTRVADRQCIFSFCAALASCGVPASDEICIFCLSVSPLAGGSRGKAHGKAFLEDVSSLRRQVSSAMLERIDLRSRSCHPTVHPRDLVDGACKDFARTLLCKAAARCAHVPPMNGWKRFDRRRHG